MPQYAVPPEGIDPLAQELQMMGSACGFWELNSHSLLELQVLVTKSFLQPLRILWGGWDWGWDSSSLCNLNSLGLRSAGIINLYHHAQIEMYSIKATL